MSFLNQISFRLLDLRIKLGSFNNKTLNLLALLLSIGIKTRFSDIEFFPRLKFIFEGFFLNCERMSIEKSKRFLQLFTNFFSNFKGDKKKLEFLELFINLKVKLTQKMIVNQEKKTIENKQESLLINPERNFQDDVNYLLFVITFFPL